MRVKRYVVDTMPEALQRIRAELGKDAIILNTKKIKIGGFFGLFAKQKIEVIAAIEVNNDTNSSAKAPTSVVATAPTATASIPKKTQTSPSHAAVLRREESIQQSGHDQPLRGETIGESEQLPVDSQLYNFKSVMAKKQSITSEGVKESHSEQATVSQLVTTQSLPVNPTAEMTSQVTLSPVSSGVTKAKEDVEDVHFKPLISRLIKQEVEPKFIDQIVDMMKTRYSTALLQNESALLQHARIIIEELLSRNYVDTSMISSKTRFVKFFGPTGVGKTTTIAKLAAECVLKSKRKVGLITTDTYRIGAVEQLRMYASILNIPLEVVHQPKEMGQALERLANCDLILMDTAGRNYRNLEYAVELVKFFPNMTDTDNFLVLSLTAKNSDMIDILNNFQHIALEKVIFTKADETQSYGSILNMVSRYHLSLSYITTGQNVPDDIQVASPDKVANLILGEDRYV